MTRGDKWNPVKRFLSEGKVIIPQQTIATRKSDNLLRGEEYHQIFFDEAEGFTGVPPVQESLLWPSIKGRKVIEESVNAALRKRVEQKVNKEVDKALTQISTENNSNLSVATEFTMETLMNAMRMMGAAAGEVGYRFTGWKSPKPQALEAYGNLIEFETTISVEGKFTAELLDTNLKLWTESDNLGYCLYRKYRAAIRERLYVAYHINAPHLSKNGYTAGFILRKDNSSIWSEKKWRVDQLRGKANSVPRDRELQTFVDTICEHLNQQERE